MELKITENIYENYSDKRLSFSEYVHYIRTGISLWKESRTFPSDEEGLKAIKIAISYRNKLMQLFPLDWKNYFTLG